MIQAIRWGGLLAYVVAMSVFYNTASQVRPRLGPITPARIKFDTPLQNPPATSDPSPDAVVQLTDVALRMEAAVLHVGHPNHASGTAFVISRKHRLLATNAHAALTLLEMGEMVAVRNRSSESYHVKRAWFHPDYTTVRDKGMYGLVDGRWVPFPGYLAPDLAVLQLIDKGSELPTEWPLVRPDEIRNVVSKPVGLMGFVGRWPEQGQLMATRLATGCVSLATDMAALSDPSLRWRTLGLTAYCPRGNSGSPVFLQDGRVIAIVAWGEPPHETGETLNFRSVSLQVDSLWRLLDYHGLSKLIEPANP